MFASLLPKSAPFFEMLLEQNTLLRHMAHHLVGMMENLDAVDDAHKQISLLEEQGDVLHVKIIRDLHSCSMSTRVPRFGRWRY